MEDDEDDARKMTFRRALRMPKFWLLFVVGLAAICRVPWWVVVPLSMVGLSISSLPKYIELWPRVRAAGVEWEWWKTVGLSMFNNFAASCAAFTFGVFSRWLWWVRGEGAMARRWLRRTASLSFVVAAVAGFGPLHAQRHGADELAPLRVEVSQLYGKGKYSEAIPLAEQYVAIARQRYGNEHTEFATAISWLASVYYAQAVRCLGAETRPGELTLGPHSP